MRLPVDGYVSPGLYRQAESVRGVKLLAVQDEYDSTSKLRRAIGDIGYHAVLTCVLERIYPREMFSHTELSSSQF